MSTSKTLINQAKKAYSQIFIAEVKKVSPEQITELKKSLLPPLEKDFQITGEQSNKFYYWKLRIERDVQELFNY